MHEMFKGRNMHYNCVNINTLYAHCLFYTNDLTMVPNFPINFPLPSQMFQSVTINHDQFYSVSY